ncbi:MAG: chromosome segregation protein SMC [Chloroflexi bacterium]|nr:chromosome segregation protein SMC [Chloroflexota bacterium]
MHLRKIELQGYKSFANRTDFAFNGGITAVVGPNGSGKSNIADAVRWVLGEQRQKSLRARRTEDLIFAGTDRRGQVGMAQVSMTLDNSSNWLPIDFAEVTITRRAYRSGENEYLLNGTRVRLQDITHLLGQGGLSSNTYTVIGQGMVDAALSLQPVQRRSLFEDAAGLAVYQAKRDAALRKLAQTEENLQRAQDIIHEITPRLGRLRRQAERAEEYGQLDEQLRDRLRLWYGYRWHQVNRGIHNSEVQLRQSRAAESESAAALVEAESQLAELRKTQVALRQRLEADRAAQAQLRESLENRNRELSVMQERARLALQRREELTTEIVALQEDMRNRQARIAELEQELANLTKRMEAQKSTLAAREAKLAEAEKRTHSLKESLAQLRRERAQLAARLTKTDRDLVQILSRRKEVEQDRTEHQRIIQEQEEKTTAIAEQMVTMRAEAAELAQQMSTISTQHAEKEAALRAVQRKKRALESQLQEVVSELRALQARYDLLSRLRKEGAGFDAGVQALLRAADSEGFKGFIGPVARLFRAHEQVVLAIQAALGARAQAIVFDTWDHAEQALLWLQKANAGRAQLLIADLLPAPPRYQVPKKPGLLGLAVDLVEYRPEDAAIVRALLGPVLVVDSWETARQYRRVGDLTVVTIAGERIGTNGVLVAGTGEQAATNILAMEREWYPLAEQIETLRKRRNQSQQRLEETARREQNLSTQLDTLAGKRAVLEKGWNSLRQNLEKAERERERVTQELEWRQELKEKGDKNLATLVRKQKTAEQILVRLRNEQRDLQQRHAELEEQLANTRVERSQQEVSQARTALALLGEQIQTHHTLLRDQHQTLDRMTQQLARRKEKQTQLHAQTEELQSNMHDSEALLLESRTTLQSLAERVNPALAELQGLEDDLVTLEEKVSTSRERLRLCQETTHQIELGHIQNKDALEHLGKQMSQDLGLVEPEETPEGIPHQSFLPLESLVTSLPAVSVLPDGLEKDVQRLRSRLGRMGAINPDAPKEYAELNERHEFLTTQSDDLAKAAQDLRQISAELDEVMRERFRTTFDAIAEAFERYFHRLFDGGEAHLILTNPDDLTNTGIDIMARVPGKRRQLISLLSGGERSLTAAALIFALLEISPTPFCLLDEVDAMLDESNIGRFRDTLVDLSRSTQFIVITHNRGTIEAADTIYGISLGDTGASRVVSLKLDEAVQMAK